MFWNGIKSRNEVKQRRKVNEGLWYLLQEILQRISSRVDGSDTRNSCDNLKHIRCRVWEMGTTRRNNAVSFQKNGLWMKDEILQRKGSEVVPIVRKYHRFVVHFVGGRTSWPFVFLTRQELIYWYFEFLPLHERVFRQDPFQLTFRWQVVGGKTIRTQVIHTHNHKQSHNHTITTTKSQKTC